MSIIVENGSSNEQIVSLVALGKNSRLQHVFPQINPFAIFHIAMRVKGLNNRVDNVGVLAHPVAPSI
jgi:hypothetical protein